MYTKGEWRVTSDKRTVIKAGKIIAYIANDAYSVVTKENEANAHLIAASPLLYEALRVAQAFITEGTKPQREKALIIITTAIAKAGGE